MDFLLQHCRWRIKVSILVQFLGYCLLKFAFTKIWIFIRRLCFGGTNCHFNVTYWSCRQPASHKSCKVPENMIYELSYGKWGLLIFLTLQNVVTYQSLSSWLNQSCFHSKRSLFPPLIWAFAHFTLTHEKCVTFLSSLTEYNSWFKFVLCCGCDRMFRRLCLTW